MVLLSLESLRARLSIHASALDALVDLIPVKNYLSPSAEEEDKLYKRKKKTSAGAVNNNTAPLHKRKKLDPATPSTTTEVQQMEKAGSTTTSSVDNSSQKNETPITLIPVVTTTNNNNISNTKSASSSISELRLKLQQRITDLQIKRRAMPTNPPLNAASAATGANADRAPRSRQEILDRRLKRKDARKQKKNGGNSVKAAEGELTTVGVKRKDCMSDTDAIAAQQKKSEMVVKDNVSFGTIQFSMGDALTGMSADAAGGRANKKHKKGPTDTIGQINKLKSSQEKLAQLEISDPEKAAAIREKQAWSKLERQAQGEKIKDNVTLLNKTLKREKKLKEKRTKEWNDRKQSVENRIADKQKKRNDNLQKRKDEKKGGSKAGGKKSATKAGGGKKPSFNKKK